MYYRRLQALELVNRDLTDRIERLERELETLNRKLTEGENDLDARIDARMEEAPRRASAERPTRASNTESVAKAPAEAAKPTTADGVDPLYNRGLAAVREGKYPEAEKIFKDFIAAHPNDRLTPNAYFWLGQALYKRKDYATASTYFMDGYRLFPKSSKAADNLLKVGLSLAEVNEVKAACTALLKLRREYPKAENRIADLARSKIAKLGCE